MDGRELCSKFCKFEKRENLFLLESNGIRYWKYARYIMIELLRFKLFGKIVPRWFNPENKPVNHKYQYNYQKYTDAFFHNVKLSSHKDILLFSFPRRVKCDNKYVSPVTDEICVSLKRSTCVVETPYDGGYYRPSSIRGIKYFDPWAHIEDEKETYTPINRRQLRKEILCSFEKEFDIHFTAEEKKGLLFNLNYCIMFRDDLMARYKKIISKVTPKVVLYTMANVSEWIILTETLKELGIPSVELLHGYVDDINIVYNYAEVGLNDVLPDYIFVFSQIQKDIIKWGIPKKNIRVVGWPWLEKKKNEVSAYVDKQKRKKTILFISCGSPVMAKYIKILAKELDKSKFEIIFKLHPTEYGAWKEQYPDMPDNIQVIDNNEHDIYFYFSKSDIVAGIVSTALYEAAIFPVPIYILAEDMHERMNILLKSERAVLVHDETELLSCILNGSEKKYKTDVSFFAEHAIENINYEIEKIIIERGKEC